jgi:hypothetical protein
MTDTNSFADTGMTEAERNAALDAAFAADQQPNPLDGFYEDERIGKSAPHDDLASAREAADELKKRRQVEQEKRALAEADALIDPVELRDSDGSRTDPKASVKSGNLRELAGKVEDYRQQRDELVAEFMQREAGEGEDNTGATTQPQQQTEQEAIDQQAALAAAAAEGARQEAARQAASEEQARQEVARQSRVDTQRSIIQNIEAAVRPFESILKTPADFHALGRINPGKLAELQQLAVAHAVAKSELARLDVHSQAEQQRQQVEQQQRQWSDWCNAQDDAFKAAHPELKDRQTYKQIQDEAYAYLKEQGMTDDQMREAWNTNATFRSKAAQDLLYTAAQHRLAIQRGEGHFQPPTTTAATDEAKRQQRQLHARR